MVYPKVKPQTKWYLKRIEMVSEKGSESFVSEIFIPSPFRFPWFWEVAGVLIETGVFVALTVSLLRIAKRSVGSSENMALLSIILGSALCGLFLYPRYTIDPDEVYRRAMTEISISTEICQIIGDPVSGYEPGGKAIPEQYKSRTWGNRCCYIFPIRGSKRTGSVTVEVKNNYRGGFDVKLLTVDIETDSGLNHRLFLVGGELGSKYYALIARVLPRGKRFERDTLFVTTDFVPWFFC